MQILRRMSTARIEVERKFRPTATLKALLQDNNAAIQPHRGRKDIAPNSKGTTLIFNRQPDRLMRDTYYDTSNAQLEKKGIWIRRRSSQVSPATTPLSSSLVSESQVWEGKVRIGGDYTDSQFLELEGQVAVHALVKQHVPSTMLEDLVATVDLITYRNTWILQEASRAVDAPQTEIRLDMDNVTAPGTCGDLNAKFEYEVGELEMTQQIVDGVDDDEKKAEKKVSAEHE